MVQKKKIRTSTSVKRKSPSASPSKRKLGKASLNWITDTTEDEEALSEQAESSKNESAGKSNEKKIGILKHYVSEDTGKKNDETPEVIPAISGSSSTITKGKGITPAKKEEAQKTEVKEKKKTATNEKLPSVPDDSAEIAREENEKTVSAKETPVEIGKTYKVTEEKKLFLAEEEEKTVFAKKETVPDEKKTSPEYEVKKEDVTTKEEISKEPSVLIPEDSTAIVKKREETTSKEEIISGEEKTPIVNEKTDPPAVKKEMPSSAKRKWKKISGTYESLKKVSPKVSESIVKTSKSDKTKVRKSVSSVINVSKQPLKTISAIDSKITQSMKKADLFSNLGDAGKSILKNIRSTDAQITKTAKKLMDSILD